MNNDRTHSAVQQTVANPGWGSADSDRLGYDGAGRMIAKRFLAGGINSSTHAYEDTAPVVGFTTAFDRASNKLYERELHAESRSHLYPDYDSLDRLRQYQRGTLASGGGSVSTAISLPSTDEQRDYILDGLGNWKDTDYTPVGGSLVEETRNHNKLNQITKRQPDDGDPWTNFTHDANGNLTDDGVRAYEWDALNRLYRVERKSDGKTIAEYVYNAATHRIRKTVSNGGLSGNVPNGETNFIYSSNWQCVEERDGSDALLRQYVWGTYIDELLQMREGSSDRYPLQDLLYRTTALADTSGSIVETYDTDAYGNTLIFDAPGTGSDWWADDAQQADVPACAFIFTGRRYDPETELYQYRHRYYAPQWGRFVGRDLFEYVDGMGLHAYYAGLLGGMDPMGTNKAYITGGNTRLYVPPQGTRFREAYPGEGGQMCCKDWRPYWEGRYSSYEACLVYEGGGGALLSMGSFAASMGTNYVGSKAAAGSKAAVGAKAVSWALAIGAGITAGMEISANVECDAMVCWSFGSWECVQERTPEYHWLFCPNPRPVCDKWECR